MLRFTTKLVAVSLLVALSCNCGKSSAPDANVVQVPPEVLGSTALPITIDVTERAGISQPNALVESGFPFAKGEIEVSALPAVENEQGQVPANVVPLSFWPDGSVRWAKLEVPIALGPLETKQLTLFEGDPMPYEVATPNLPPMTLRLATDSGPVTFNIEPTAYAVQGKHGIEIDIEPLTPNSVRLRVMVAQLDGDATWSSLTLELSGSSPTAHAQRGAGSVGGWSAAVRYAKDREQTQAVAQGNLLKLHLYHSATRPYPADEGFHASHEIILERGIPAVRLAEKINSPTRVTIPPSYLDSTRAMGRIGVTDEEEPALDAAFESSWALIRDQQALPKNRGWTTWGDFDVRGHGLAYSGYLNQEYDPALAFFLYSARTGNESALDTALLMARQYADNGLSLEGGCYQHRATLHMLERYIARAIATKMQQDCSIGEGGTADEQAFIAHIDSEYGSSTSRKVTAWFEEDDSDSAEERLDQVSERFGFALLVATREEAENDPSDAALALAEENATLEDYAAYLCSAEFVSAVGVSDHEAILAPLFARYGGSWADFPSIHSCDLPDKSIAHSGGHELVEMLVQGYLRTGNISMRRAALRMGKFLFDGGVIADGIEQVKADHDRGKPIMARMVGWPLLSLIALKPLTEHGEPELDALFDQGIQDLLNAITDLPANRYHSVLQAGVVSEALARWHEETGSEQARDYMLELVWFWSTSQWNGSERAFNYVGDSGKPADPALCGLMLYGVAYSARLTQDPMLAERAQDTLNLISEGPESYVKEFAQKFRSSQRALSLIPHQIQ